LCRAVFGLIVLGRDLSDLWNSDVLGLGIDLGLGGQGYIYTEPPPTPFSKTWGWVRDEHLRKLLPYGVRVGARVRVGV
jgi:hypothetical protein